MRWNKLVYILKRAFAGAARRPLLYGLSLLTLTAAFVSFAATLTAAANLDALLSRWMGAAELTVYVKEGATDGEYEKLAAAIAKLDGVARTEKVLPSLARKRFAEGLGDELGEMASTLPEGAFPGSVEVFLSPHTARDPGARKAFAGRLGQVSLVQEVDLYDDWFDRLAALSVVGRVAAFGLGLIAFLVAVLVVTTIIRTNVNERRREIDVLELVGATDVFVRLPFLLEGALQAALAMGLALGAVQLLTGYLERLAATLLPLFGVGQLSGISPTAALALVGGAGLAGLFGARLSLRNLGSTP